MNIEDLMFLFGWRKGEKYGKWEKIKVQAQNDWLDGKNADANPYRNGSLEADVWYKEWKKCNINN